MFSIHKGAINYFKQIRRSAVAVGNNVAKKSTSAINIHHKFANKEQSNAENEAPFSNTISFSSPESDFCTPHIRIKSNFIDLDYEHEHTSAKNVVEAQPSYSGTLSFTSPEADFSSSGSIGMYEEATTTTAQTSEQQEIKVAKNAFFQNLEQKSDEKDKLAYTLSFATPESDFSNPALIAMLGERQKKQLQNTSLLHHSSANQLSSIVEVGKKFKAQQGLTEGKDVDKNIEYHELRAHAELLSHEDPLPTKIEEATISNDDRAIVITEAEVPFKIVTVNSAWEHLCGYTRDECSGKTLRCIQGPETNQAAITALMSNLLRGEEAGTVLVNYKKDGSKFLNRLRVGALRDDNNAVTHFVGVLKEVEEMADKFNTGASRILVQD